MYNFLETFLIIIIIVAPIAWIISEFKASRRVRIILGVIALCTSFAVACFVGILTMFNYNTWYGAASENLINAVIEELEEGNIDKVIKELKVLQTNYKATYENKARYDVLTNETIESLTSKK